MGCLISGGRLAGSRLPAVNYARAKLRDEGVLKEEKRSQKERQQGNFDGTRWVQL
jgi:hypothetical protein